MATLEVCETKAATIVKVTGKRRYSRGLRGPQVLERRGTKAASRLVDAVQAGLDRWSEARDRSALERRDGALIDLPRNAVKAWVKAVRVGSKAPLILVRGIRVRSVRGLTLLPPFCFFR